MTAASRIGHFRPWGWVFASRQAATCGCQRSIAHRQDAARLAKLGRARGLQLRDSRAPCCHCITRRLDVCSVWNGAGTVRCRSSLVGGLARSEARADKKPINRRRIARLRHEEFASPDVRAAGSGSSFNGPASRSNPGPFPLNGGVEA